MSRGAPQTIYGKLFYFKSTRLYISLIIQIFYCHYIKLPKISKVTNRHGIFIMPFFPRKNLEKFAFSSSEDYAFCQSRLKLIQPTCRFWIWNLINTCSLFCYFLSLDKVIILYKLIKVNYFVLRLHG